jgi:hypothetical protein
MRIGMGDFVGASFPLPQNPLALNGMGEFVPACFPLPQNPVGLRGMEGCECGGKCRTGMDGLVDDITSSVTGAWDSVTNAFGSGFAGGFAGGSMQTYLIVGGIVLAGYVLMSRGGGYRAQASSLRREYQQKAAALRSRSGRGYARIGKAGRAAYAAF